MNQRIFFTNELRAFAIQCQLLCEGTIFCDVTCFKVHEEESELEHFLH